MSKETKDEKMHGASFSNKQRSNLPSGFVRETTAGNQYQQYFGNYQQVPSKGQEQFNYPQIPAAFIIMPPVSAGSRDFNQLSPQQISSVPENEEEKDASYQSPGMPKKSSSQGRYSASQKPISPLSEQTFAVNQFFEAGNMRESEYQYGNFAPPTPMGMPSGNNWSQSFPIPMPLVPIPVGVGGVHMPPYIPNSMDRPLYSYNKNAKKKHYNNPSYSRNKGDYNRKNSLSSSNYLLDDSFMNKGLEDFQGQLYELSIQQQGSRFIQKKLTKENIGLALDELLPHVVELSQHSFGNYLVQKLVELGNESQKLKILNILNTSKAGIIGIACDPHGTRTLQRIVSELMEFDDGVSALIDTFKGKIVSLTENLNGNHVIQELLASLQPPDIQFIFDEISDSIEEVSVERHGCCVLQRCIDNGDKAQISNLCKLVLDYTLELAKDPFGNYVVQYILQMEKDRYFYLKGFADVDLQDKSDEIFVWSRKILDDLSSHLKSLCFHKFGSNVIENLMKLPCGLSSGLFEQLIALFKNEGSKLILDFLTDPFANYVLQTSLLSSQKQSTNNSYFATFVSLLKPVIEREINILGELAESSKASPQKVHENSVKMLQLQRVLTICTNDYLRNKDSTNYNSWGPNFSTKNHESFGFDKKKIKSNRGGNFKSKPLFNFPDDENLLSSTHNLNFSKETNGKIQH